LEVGGKLPDDNRRRYHTLIEIAGKGDSDDDVIPLAQQVVRRRDGFTFRYSHNGLYQRTPYLGTGKFIV
jgi:hypothetical protein